MEDIVITHTVIVVIITVRIFMDAGKNRRDGLNMRPIHVGRFFVYYVKMKIPKGVRYLVGVDEAGRGPLAGTVAVGVACVFFGDKNFKKFSRGVRDSKKLSERQREEWFVKMAKEKGKGKGFDFSVAFAGSEMIDTRGLSFAIRHALANALKKLRLPPEEAFILLDGGLRAPKKYLHQKTIIHGDDLEPIISLASVAAKVSRDKRMRALAKKYTEYGFEKHKGYGTKAHYEAIEKYGILEGIHRKSFLGIKIIGNCR
jgi:ribonuclease HII